MRNITFISKPKDVKGRGSLAHFYHFLYGLYLPLIYQIKFPKWTNITLPSCGPMNKHLRNLPGFNVNIVPATTIASLNYQRINCLPWDTFWCSQKNNKQILTAEMLSIVNKKIDKIFDIKNIKRDIDILFINRGVSTCLLDYDCLENINHENVTNPETPGVCYDKTAAEQSPLYNSGATRRSIYNAMGLITQLNKLAPVTIAELTHMPIQDQFRLFSRAKVIIGQHGAGLSHAFRANSESLLIEIQPIDMYKSGAECFTMFEKICNLNNINYTRILQSDPTRTVTNLAPDTKDDRYYPGVWSADNKNNHAPVKLDDNILKLIQQYI